MQGDFLKRLSGRSRIGVRTCICSICLWSGRKSCMKAAAWMSCGIAVSDDSPPVPSLAALCQSEPPVWLLGHLCYEQDVGTNPVLFYYLFSSFLFVLERKEPSHCLQRLHSASFVYLLVQGHWFIFFSSMNIEEKNLKKSPLTKASIFDIPCISKCCFHIFIMILLELPKYKIMIFACSDFYVILKILIQVTLNICILLVLKILLANKRFGPFLKNRFTVYSVFFKVHGMHSVFNNQ